MEVRISAAGLRLLLLPHRNNGSLQDTWVAKDAICGKPGWGFFGVFDGHGGAASQRFGLLVPC